MTADTPTQTGQHKETGPHKETGQHKEAVLLLGSNAGESRAVIEAAMRAVTERMGAAVFSEVYESEDATGRGPAYLNVVARVETAMDADSLRDESKELERRAGRKAGDKAAGRVPLDVDVVIYDGAVLRPADFAAAHFRRGFAQL